MFRRKTYELRGTVQGVGFRPAVFRMAVSAGLGGWVKNTPSGVLLRLEGAPSVIDSLVSRLCSAPPPPSVVAECRMIDDAPIGSASASFEIIESDGGERKDVSIPADIAVCSDCAREIFDPADRRFMYPFTTCAVCGPRHTVINSMPYDRERTTMAAFPLCADCAREYGDPSDRRFHAESVACPKCGPKLSFCDANGRELAGVDPLAMAAERLRAGAVVALKGIGGFQLVADALNIEAVRTLRERKNRPSKPFAVMCDSVGTIRKYCEMSGEEEALLKSPAAPIVILNLMQGLAPALCGTLSRLSPDTATLGVMLPCSPLHMLLLRAGPFEMIVATSGNRGGEPICIKNSEAVERLAGIADFFLFHDREINLRNDDSIAVSTPEGPQVWRRARGHAPRPLTISKHFKKGVLAMGAEMKNTIAFGYDDKIVLSPHIGDLDTLEAVESLERTADELPAFLGRPVEAVAVDMHPDMRSTIFGRQLAERLGVEVFTVQHHHAHAASCLAENGLDEALALVFDGTGIGPDGTVWGAELLEVGGGDFRRLATFAPAPLPGGDAAIREPARQLIGRLIHHGFDDKVICKWGKKLGIDEEKVLTWQRQVMTGVNCPSTHAAGRLFDSFACLCGVVKGASTYDGQYAVKLEATAKRRLFKGENDGGDLFDCEKIDNLLLVDWEKLFVKYALKEGWDVFEDAQVFHSAVVSASVKMLEHGLENSSVRNVIICGGVFMNRLLSGMLAERVRGMGLRLFTNREIPPNDGGVAAGQAFVACEKMRL